MCSARALSAQACGADDALDGFLVLGPVVEKILDRHFTYIIFERGAVFPFAGEPFAAAGLDDARLSAVVPPEVHHGVPFRVERVAGAQGLDEGELFLRAHAFRIDAPRHRKLLVDGIRRKLDAHAPIDARRKQRAVHAVLHAAPAENIPKESEGLANQIVFRAGQPAFVYRVVRRDAHRHFRKRRRYGDSRKLSSPRSRLLPVWHYESPTPDRLVHPCLPE